MVVTCISSEALLFRTQIEKQFALRFGGGQFDHAPVFDDVFVNFSFDPVHGIADQTHAVIRVEALDGFHQTDIAFLNQVSVRKSVTGVLA